MKSRTGRRDLWSGTEICQGGATHRNVGVRLNQLGLAHSETGISLGPVGPGA